jgi:hypothetical protein
MISNSTQTNREQGSYLRDVLVIAILVGGTLLCFFGIDVMQYRIGLTLYKEAWSYNIALLFALTYFALTAAALLIQFVRVLTQGVKFGIKRACLQISFMVITVLVFFLSPKLVTLVVHPQCTFTKGLLKTMESRADVSAIRAWLDTADVEGAGTFKVDEGRWPEAIKELSPKLVFVTRTASDRVYVRLIWGSGVTGEWGVVIGANSTEAKERYKSEYRREWPPDAFVWHEDR